MKRFIEYELETGGKVLVQVEESRPGLVEAGLGDGLAEKASQKFDAALATMGPVAEAALRQFQALAVAPAEVELSFGIKMSADFGAFVASLNGEANFEVKLTWKRAESAKD